MYPRRLIPSMSLLVAFEASARHQSFTRAAKELSLTQSAVSRQVHALEALLDVELFKRDGRRIMLSDAGAMYWREVASALDKVRGASLQAISFRPGTGALRLAVLPTFASKWLLPRLHRFYQRYPNVIIHVHSRFDQINDFALAGVDAAIGIRDNNPKNLVTHPLQDEYPVPIASPTLMQGHSIHTAKDLSKHLLLHVANRPQAWAEWFAAQGLDSSNAHTGPQFELTSHLIQCVAVGIGVGLVPRVLVEEELQKGTLLIPVHAENHSRRCFCLTYPAQNTTLSQLVAFKNWLLEEITSSCKPENLVV